MYLGNIIEIADKDMLFNTPLHPYTQALLSAIPIPDPKIKNITVPLEGDVPSPINPPAGCCFHTRCKYAKEICKIQKTVLGNINNSHAVACHLITHN